MFLRILLYISTCLLSVVVYSQSPSNKIDLFPPLRGSLFLSGAFGEIRTDHFHSGVDFRTGGKINAPVYSSEKGYVSRIKISGGGFGKALYIDHPNGYTTVYAHLDRFTEHIDAFILNEQYRKEQFEVDVYLKPNQIRVERGEHIAWSGNSGSSGGPHLHYEVRRSSDQMPINPSFSNLPIADNLKPSVLGIWIHNLEPGISSAIKNRIPLKFEGTQGCITLRDTILVSGTVGIAIEAYDFINTGSLRCGVNGMSMTINDSPWYSFQINGFLFSDTRFANSHIDYAMRIGEGKRVHKLYIDPNNQISIYGAIQNQGKIATAPDSLYRVKVSVSDSYGNETLVRMTLKGVAPIIGVNTATDSIAPVEWNFYDANSFDSEDFTISMPEYALYNNLSFTHNVLPRPVQGFSPVFQICSNLVPIHKAYMLSIGANSLPKKYQNKALLASFDPKGKIISHGGTWKEGHIVASLHSFGDFFVAVDTVPPSLTPINIFNGKHLSNQETINFKVEDNLSGIKTIRGTIDGKWALFEHDPKNKLVFYVIDRDRLGSQESHSLELNICDQKGNVSHYKCRFTL